METLKEYIQNSDLTPNEILIELNSKSELIFIKIPTIEIKRYLIVIDKWMNIKLASSQSTIQEILNLTSLVIETLNIFKSLSYDDEIIRAKVDLMLLSLVAVGLIETEHEEYIKNLGIKKISKVSKYGLNRIDMETIMGLIK